MNASIACIGPASKDCGDRRKDRLHYRAMHFGQALRALREQRRLSQEQLAERVGVTRQAIGRWEDGGGIEMKHLPLLAKALRVRVEALFQDPARPAGDSPRSDRELRHVAQQTAPYTALANESAGVEAPLLTLDDVRRIAKSTSEEEAVAVIEKTGPWRADLGPLRARIKIGGDAMDDATREAIADGTEAVFILLAEPQHGDRVLAVLADDRVLVRRYDITGEGVHLVATNPSFPERMMPLPKDARIVGVLEYTVRRYR